MGFYWNLNNNKSLHVSRTSLSILSDSQQCCRPNGLDSSADFTLSEFFTQVFSHKFLRLVFKWNLSDSKSSQFSRTFKSILAYFDSAVNDPVSSSDLQSPQFLFQASEYRRKSSNYNWYHNHFLCSTVFQLTGKILVFIYLFVLFYFR